MNYSTRNILVAAGVLLGLVSPALATESVTMAFSKPTNTVPATVKVLINPGPDVTVVIPVGTSAETKRNLIRDALLAPPAAYDVTDNGGGGNQLTINHLTNGTTVTFDPGTTGELRDDVVGRNVTEARVAFQGFFDPHDPLGPPAIFTAGIVTDVGELTATISAAELNFQTDGPIICQALFQRLAPRAPQYGAQINYAGDRLEVYFDPAYTVTQGGIIFGTSSLSSGASGGVTVVARCPADYNGDGFVDGIDYDMFNNDFESTDPVQQMNADYNGDGFVDGIDYDMFNNDFEGGC